MMMREIECMVLYIVARNIYEIYITERKIFNRLIREKRERERHLSSITAFFSIRCEKP